MTPEEFQKSLDNSAAKDKQNQAQSNQTVAVNKAGIKTVQAVNANTKSTADGLKNVKGEVKVTNPDLAKTDDLNNVVDSINKMNVTTFMANTGYQSMADNIQHLSQEVQTLQQHLQDQGLTSLSNSFQGLVGRLETVSKSLVGTKVTVDNSIATSIDALKKSIDNMDFNPSVNVTAPTPKVTTKPIDLSPIVAGLSNVEQAIKDSQTEDDSEDKIDLQPIVSGLSDVQNAITNLHFPVANYVLPFKDSNGKAVQVQLDASGNVPTSGGGGGGGGTTNSGNTIDATPATQNITVVDSVSSTGAGANSQSIITGSPTANSAASFTLAGYDTVVVQISGTWTGTLQSEVSFDSGTTWYIRGFHQVGTAYNASTVTANALGVALVAGATNYRVRATAAMTGTAVVKVVETVNPSSVYLINTPGLADGTIPSQKLAITNDGQALMTPALRANVLDQNTTITSSTAATTIVNAVSSKYCDLVSLVLTNISATGTEVQLFNDDGTTVRNVFYVPATDMRGITFSVPFTQAAQNVTWKLKTVTSVASLKITAQFIQHS